MTRKIFFLLFILIFKFLIFCLFVFLYYLVDLDAFHTKKKLLLNIPLMMYHIFHCDLFNKALFLFQNLAVK